MIWESQKRLQDAHRATLPSSPGVKMSGKINLAERGKSNTSGLTDNGPVGSQTSVEHNRRTSQN